MSTQYDDDLQKLKEISDDYVRNKQFEQEAQQKARNQEDIEHYRTSQHHSRATSFDSLNFVDNSYFDDTRIMQEELVEYRKQQLKETMAPIYLMMKKYQKLFEYLPNVENQILEMTNNYDYIKHVPELRKNIEFHLIPINDFLHFRVFNVLDKDESIRGILKKHLEKIDLFNFNADIAWHELNKDILCFRNEVKELKIQQQYEINAINMAHQTNLDRLNAIEEQKQRQRLLFAECFKIDEYGNILPAESSSWCALSYKNLMWIAGNSFTLPNLMNVSFDQVKIEKILSELNARGYCGFHNWRLPTRDELYEIYKHHASKENKILPDVADLSNPSFWSSSETRGNSNQMSTMNFRSGNVVNIQKNQLCHIRFVRDI